MASVDRRIKNAARRAKERRDQLNKAIYLGLPGIDELRALFERQDLEELRELLNDEIFNMQERFRRALAIHDRYLTNAHRRLFVKHLHTKTFDDTYRDYAPSTKYPRTRERIDALIKLCDGNEELFLREYTASIEKFFPIDTWSSRFDWNLVIFERALKPTRRRRKITKFKTIRHRMSYRKVEASSS